MDAIPGAGDLPLDAVGQLWEMAKTAGPFGTVLVLFFWWRCDKERIKERGSNEALTERALAGLNASTNAFEKVAELLSRRRT